MEVERRIKIICWNINGIRALLRKLNTNLAELFHHWDADIVCFQEIRIDKQSISKINISVPGYDSFWSFCETKKGYSGVVTYARKGLTISHDEGFILDKSENVKVVAQPKVSEVNSRLADKSATKELEGRIIKTNHGKFHLFNVYFPNGGLQKQRLEYKLEFYKNFEKMCQEYINNNKNVIIVGDFNTIHESIDASNKYKDDYQQEKIWMVDFLNKGFVDIFRYKHKNEPYHYTWTQYNTHRDKNIGIRLDYILTNKLFFDKVKYKIRIMKDQIGSDHFPIIVRIKC